MLRFKVVFAVVVAISSDCAVAEPYRDYVARGFEPRPSQELQDALREAGFAPLNPDDIDEMVHANEAFLDAAAHPAGGTRPSSDARVAVPLLVQLVREWSVYGRAQRIQSFALLVEAMLEALSGVPSPHILVPGSGLGRVVHDLAEALALHKPSLVAVEADVHAQLLARSMLEPDAAVNQDADRLGMGSGEHCEASTNIYPSLHMATGWANATDRIAPVAVPDVSLARRRHVQGHADVSLVVGRFPQALLGDSIDAVVVDAAEAVVVDAAEAFDGAVTCYFLDVAPDILRVIASMHALLLARNGTWANLGPLAYPDTAPLESMGGTNDAHALTATQLVALVRSGGFDIIEQRMVDCEYGGLPRRLERGFIRTCLFFVAKPHPRR